MESDLWGFGPMNRISKTSPFNYVPTTAWTTLLLKLEGNWAAWIPFSRTESRAGLALRTNEGGDTGTGQTQSGPQLRGLPGLEGWDPEAPASSGQLSSTEELFKKCDLKKPIGQTRFCKRYSGCCQRLALI